VSRPPEGTQDPGHSQAPQGAPGTPPQGTVADRRRGTHPPVRMLHIITRLIRGGADENTLYTVRGLDKRRYTVDLVVGEGSELEAFGPLQDVTVHVVKELVRDPHPVKDVVALVKLTGIIRRGHYQIVHTHTAKAGFLGRLAAAMVGSPIIVHTVHGVTFHDQIPAAQRFFYLALERIAARFTHQFVTVGEDVKDIYLRSGIGQAHRYETIYSGMALDEYLDAGHMSDEERARVRASLGLEPGHRVVAMAARLEPRKGHQYLLQAVQRLKGRVPDLRVLLLGDGAIRQELEWQAQALGISDIVMFLGHRSDLARVLAASDVSVLTSLWEGLPRVLVQSAACGRPILTFDVEGAWEVVRDGRNGFIVPSKDVDAFTARLETLLADHEHARALGEAGRAQVSDAWTVETMLTRLDRLYQRLAGDRAA
jgi:glycosyltransferase involved in cell wall biosynthesis